MSNSTRNRLDVHPVSGALGAEVHDVDLASVTDGDFEQIHELLLKYLVLFFPNQHALTPETHIAFARRFGEPEIHPFIPKLDGHPEIVVLDSKGGFKADVWHTDNTCEPSPPILSVLQLKLCPPMGGDTMWSNQYLVYESLSQPLRELLDGLTAIHVIKYPGETSERRTEHPVVRIHPETGRRSLYVNRLYTSHIPQLSPRESKMLLEYLFTFAEEPRFACRYRWAPESVAMWDNRATQHYAVNDYTEQRIGQRVTILGDNPTGNPPRWDNYQAGGRSAADYAYR
ncbi:MAG: TauD/TfdA family dioxygenase [Kutzneria sp.]|nr:TauD/TfdA family dioxygenase [Kutzneria sp.]